MSNQTGISAYKIYKWLDGKGNPKHEDAKKLELWLNSNMEEVPNFGNLAPTSAQPPSEANYLPEYIASLKEHNAFLQELVKINLASLSDTQRIILAQVKAGLQFEARKIGQGNKKKEEQVLKDLNTLVSANMQGVSNVGSKVGDGM